MADVQVPKSDVKNKDMALWRQWKRTNAPADLQLLLTQMNPIIMREVNKWSPALSRSLLEMEGKRLAVEAFKTYDPDRGVALSTHVASRLPKLSRMVYSNQNTARLSETNALLFHSYNQAKNTLRDRLGREPAHDELADELAWSPKKLEVFERQASRKEFIESEDHPENDDNKDDYLVDFIYHDLTPLQKKVFEYATGYRGSPQLSNQEIMKKLDLTQGQLSYQKGLVADHVQRVRKTHHG